MKNTAVPADRSWTGMKATAAEGAIPAKVSVKTRANVTAGLPKEVDTVKK